MNLIQAIILAIVEGITEFLPISSTGHLVLVSGWLGIGQSEFVKSFEIAIQLGAIMAIVPVFIKELLKDYRIGLKTAAAFIPTGIVGVLAFDFIKGVLIGNAAVTAAALAGGGIFMIWWEKRKKTKAENGTLTYKRAIIVGTCQILAMVPGVSRAAATMMGGEMTGLPRAEAVKFSFLLAVVTMAAATGLDAIKTQWRFSGGEWGILGGGMVVAMITAWIAANWLLKYVRKHDLSGFGWYRIGLAAVWLLTLM